LRSRRYDVPWTSRLSQRPRPRSEPRGQATQMSETGEAGRQAVAWLGPPLVAFRERTRGRHGEPGDRPPVLAASIDEMRRRPPCEDRSGASPLGGGCDGPRTDPLTRLNKA
jgi:hypothetical protein